MVTSLALPSAKRATKRTCSSQPTACCTPSSVRASGAGDAEGSGTGEGGGAASPAEETRGSGSRGIKRAAHRHSRETARLC